MNIEEGVYFYNTEESHADNAITMNDFLENELPDTFDVILVEGTYAEIQDDKTGDVYEVHAGGAGDFTHHRIDFVQL